MQNKLSYPASLPQVSVVEASAGSGKTFELVRQYIRFLINPHIISENIPLRHIIAITFTNKAAFEMKQRIISSLKKIALDLFLNEKEKEEVLSFLCMDEKTARSKAHIAIDYLIRNYNFFQVRTIDSFINALLSGCALKLGLSSSFKIKDYCDEYLEYSFDNLADKMSSDRRVGRILKDVLHHYLFIENKESWFPRQDILSLIGSLFSITNIYGYRFAKSGIKSTDIINKRKYIIRLMSKLRKRMPGGTKKQFLKSFDKFLEGHVDSFDIAEIPGGFGKAGFPGKSSCEISLKIKGLWDEIRHEINELCQLEAYSKYDCYVDIFNEVYEFFKEFSDKEDVVFLEELNQKARMLFAEESITVDELYYRLATRFRYFLIDEFQDTSKLQWGNIVTMVEEALSTGGALFYVGDKKQAIYRFRGGEISLFDEIRRKYSNYTLDRKFLNVNYRSQKELVEFNNEIFSTANLGDFLNNSFTGTAGSVTFSPEDIADVLSVFSGARQTYVRENDFGYLEAVSVDAENREERDNFVREELINLLTGLKERFSYGKIAILARSNDEIELVTSWLMDSGVPVESDKTLNISENFIVKELITFLRFLESPVDNLSFASFLFGDIFASASGLSKETVRDFVFRLRRDLLDKDKKIYLYKEFIKKYPAEWNKLIRDLFKTVGTVPIYEFIITIIIRFNITGAFPEHQAFIMKFLELVKSKEDEYGSIPTFLDYFESAPPKDLYVHVAGTDAVKIITIHQSKGLEFDVVVLPFFSMNIKISSGGGFSRNRGGKNASGAYLLPREGMDLKLLHLRKKYTIFSPQLKKFYKDEYKKALIDELNLTYVALTRAKKELYMFIPRKVSNARNILRSFLPSCRVKRGKKIVYTEREKNRKQRAQKLPISRHKDWVGRISNELIDRSEIVNRGDISKGEVFHSIFSFIGNLENANAGAVIEAALHKTKGSFPFFDDWSDCGRKARDIVMNPAHRDLFFVSEGKVYQEKNIVDKNGTTKRVDRLIVKNEEVFIIDFKSSSGTGKAFEHENQVNEYKGILREIYPDKTVKGFLLYIETAELKEVLDEINK